MSEYFEKAQTQINVPSPALSELSQNARKPLRHRIREIVWDSLDRDPEERRLVFKIDIFIL